METIDIVATITIAASVGTFIFVMYAAHQEFRNTSIMDWIMSGMLSFCFAAIVFLIGAAIMIGMNDDNLPENCAKVVTGHHTQYVPIMAGKTTVIVPTTINEYEVVCAEEK